VHGRSTSHPHFVLLEEINEGIFVSDFFVAPESHIKVFFFWTDEEKIRLGNGIFGDSISVGSSKP